MICNNMKFNFILGTTKDGPLKILANMKYQLNYKK